MKNFAWRIVGAVLVVGAFFLTNCSGPLESAKAPTPGQVDSIYITDTVYSGDTVIYTDTVQVTDTVIVVVTDTLMIPMSYCAQLSSHQREIVWLFQNAEGPFRLEFAAASTRDWPIQELRVEVDGQEHIWEPTLTSVFVWEINLAENSSVRISSGSPPALGHAIDICLKLQDR